MKTDTEPLVLEGPVASTRSSRVAWAVAFAALVLTSLASPAQANDRLPPRLRPAYARALGEARKYVRFLIDKIWAPKLAALVVSTPDARLRRGRAARLVDELVQLVLPHSRRLLQDVIFGTGETHLALTLPERGKLAPLRPGQSPLTGDLIKDAIDRASRVQERALEDRLEQALAEDLEDHVQREAEGRVGLRVVGRPRELVRPLPRTWRKPYEKVREDVHRFVYWWMRRRQRLKLTHMARTMTPAEIDRARHGEMWGVTSAVSYEAWAQHRYRMDFKYGRFDWEVHRRRIRRRMDQDQARAGWGLTRLVRELTSPETQEEMRRHLDRRVDEELSRAPLREKAEGFPDSGPELQKQLERLKQELEPIMDRAMDRVELPPDMRDLARVHGRRFAHEELEGELPRSIQRGAAPYAAARRVRERLGDWVQGAKARLDLGERPADTRSRKETLRREVMPLVDDEIEGSLRQSGLDADLADPGERRKAIENVRKKFRIDEQVDELLGEGAP
jgi:hypothetical protein